jgi:hypothetical protein
VFDEFLGRKSNTTSRVNISQRVPRTVGGVGVRFVACAMCNVVTPVT